jgi:hypothetical protein
MPGVMIKPYVADTPEPGTLESFDDATPGNWDVATDTSGTDSTVERSSTEAYYGTYSAKCFTTNTGAKAQVRYAISSPWSGVSADTNSYIWQRAWIYVPVTVAILITGSEYIDLAAFYVSGDASGWYLRMGAGTELYGVGPGSSGQAVFNLYGTFPTDRWVEVEIGLWSRASGDLDRAACFIVNGKFYGWFTNGEAETDYDRAAMGIVATNSNDNLTVYVDEWDSNTTGAAPAGTDNRPTANSYTKDYTGQSGENVGYHYTTWENGYTYDATYGMTPSSRLQFGPEHSLMPDLSDGWSQIVMDWAGGSTPPYPPDLMGEFFGPMIAFRKSVELEENLEIVPKYRSGAADLVYESWTSSAVEYAEWAFPEDADGHRLPGSGDIIRVRWQETSATEIRVRVDYYDASATTWYTDVIDDTRALNNVSGVNFLEDTHRTVTGTIDSNDYTIKSQTIGILSTYPG